MVNVCRHDTCDAELLDATTDDRLEIASVELDHLKNVGLRPHGCRSISKGCRSGAPSILAHFRKLCWCRILSLLKASRQLVIFPALCSDGWSSHPATWLFGQMLHTRFAPLYLLKKVRRAVRFMCSSYGPMDSRVGTMTSLWKTSSSAI